MNVINFDTEKTEDCFVFFLPPSLLPTPTMKKNM